MGRRGRRGGKNSVVRCAAEVELPDEDVLIAFAPYMRSENKQALEIHAQLQASNDQKAFMKAARDFLDRVASNPQLLEQTSEPTMEQTFQSNNTSSEGGYANQQLSGHVSTQKPLSFLLPPQDNAEVPNNHHDVVYLEQRMHGLSVKEDPVVPMTQTPPTNAVANTGMTPIMTPPGLMGGQSIDTHRLSFSPAPQQQQHQHQPPPGWTPQIMLPTCHSGTSYTPQQQQQRDNNMLAVGLNTSPMVSLHGDEPVSTPSMMEEQTSILSSPPPPATAVEEKTPAKVSRYQPKRLWTRIEEQPGRLIANNFPHGHTLRIRPKQELTAQWMLPMAYLREKHNGGDCNQSVSFQEALEHLHDGSLQVGLFRKGCIDNSTSIISKEATMFQMRGDMVVGSVPFYTPRTPGNVVLRMFWRDDPVYTLATGPTLAVIIERQDVQPTMSFILSNFKKGSLSSLHSLITVLENFRVTPAPRQKWDRVMLACMIEARKVLDGCAKDYIKAKEKLVQLENQIDELTQQVAAEEERDEAIREVEPSVSSERAATDNDLKETLKDKWGVLRGGRSSNERKWRDAQVAFASMLKALATNEYCSGLVSPELMTKIRLEIELYCPLCEAFAPSPFNSDADALFTCMDDFPDPVEASHFKQATASREKIQQDWLGFVPNSIPLERVLFSEKASSNEQSRSMNPVAVGVFNRLSKAMGELFQQEYMVSDRIHQQRELVRSHIESFVTRCDAFPAGTRVVVFGSSANGFGSPSSDLDMCLQLPPNTKLADENDPTGAEAMAKLAALFEEGGLKDVNTDRLTARIPIVMFACQRPLASDDEDPMMECDVSMQNPLACLNTSLLLTYSEIHPVTRVLASIVKRWAKSRDINSPSNHTLSTYGYILMLLHFLTFHRRAGTGLVTPIVNRTRRPWTPLLPNLQWMDDSWPNSPAGTPYRELSSRPRQLMPHPFDPSFSVNTYFYRLKDPNALLRLQQLFPGQDLSLSILLTSFFRYYAYEFDYKHQVVSLNSTLSKGLILREDKAENDCWKIFGTGLAIEDPFETFYDVAHVLKGSNYHRIRNEFALAYTKIVNAISGATCNMDNHDLLDWICEPYVKEDCEE